MTTTFRYRSRTRPGAWKFLVVLALIAIAFFTWQQRYIRGQLPLIAAEVAVANGEVASVFDQLSPPHDAKPLGELEKRPLTGGRRGKWQGVTTGLKWSRRYEVPGDFGPIADGYRKRLQGLGWVSFDDTPPSDFQRVFKRGKWIATLSGNEWWDYPRRTGVTVLLEWDFRHRTDYP